MEKVAADLERGLGRNGVYKVCCGFIAVVVLLVAILVPVSLGKVGSDEVAIAYDNVGSKLGDEILTEGLQTKPIFGSLILWPNTNQEIDMSLTCNSADAIQVELTIDFLYIPLSSMIRELTLLYKDYEGYRGVVYSVARSSVRNSCGDFSALEFQTRRDEVQLDMERRVRTDLSAALHAEVLSLNLRNIERPVAYQDAVNLREAARADIMLATKETEQALTKASTVLQEAYVNSNKTQDNAITDADILVANAKQEVKVAAEADTVLASKERAQKITQAQTTLQAASIEAVKTIALARTDAAVTEAFAQNEYNSTLDKYIAFGRALKNTMDENNLTISGVLAYFGSSIIGGSDARKHVSLDQPAKFSYRSEL